MSNTIESLKINRNEQYRYVYLNDKNNNINYCSNFIVTSKYTILSFLPKFLFETFRKIANGYFLLISILQCIPNITTTNGIPATLPTLMFIVAIDAIFAILEDRKRHIADQIANSRKVKVYDIINEKFIIKTWADLLVGDIILLVNREPVPADILILSVNELPTKPPTGICYLETKSLDGETNLKLRQAMESTMIYYNTLDKLKYLKGYIECEKPNNSINKFNGILNLYDITTTSFTNNNSNNNNYNNNNSNNNNNNNSNKDNNNCSNNSNNNGTNNNNNKSSNDNNNKSSNDRKNNFFNNQQKQEEREQKNEINNFKKDTTYKNDLNNIQPIKESICVKSILLRGCIIRNTEWVYGCVINTGKDTKIMMSSTATPSKMSSMDYSINMYIVSLVIVLILFCIIGATCEIIWIYHNSNLWYLSNWSPNKLNEWIIMGFYYFLLMYQFVPISLYVSMSMVKYIQSQFMQWDKQMYYNITDTPMIVRTMNLNEELGQISYLFSDKTGTLTCNIMEFRKCSINGITYGLDEKIIDNPNLSIPSITIQNSNKHINQEEIHKKFKKNKDGSIKKLSISPKNSSNAYLVSEKNYKKLKYRYVQFNSPEIFLDLNGNKGMIQKNKIKQFLYHLSICHTVIPEKLENSNEITLSASSPDEQALVSWASYMGYKFINRSPGIAFISIDDDENHEKIEKFDILDILEFSSTRKRMSIIVKDIHNNIYLYTKGADTVIFPRLIKDINQNQTNNQMANQSDNQSQNEIQNQNQNLEEMTLRHIDTYAQEGLRTLTIAMRKIDLNYYNDWSNRYHKALNDLKEIDKQKNDISNKIDDCIEEIEKDLELLGATAIKDKLQEGVPDTISNLSKAGIKIWILTGDKEETAINIGYSCHLINNNMRQIILNNKNCPTPQHVLNELQIQFYKRLQEISLYNTYNNNNSIKDDTIGICNTTTINYNNNNNNQFMATVPTRDSNTSLNLNPSVSNINIKKDIALIIDGDILEIALEEPCRELLLKLSQCCKALIACRVSPAQKAQMVSLIKKNVSGVRTLAIGDGANDVSMIQEAHVGVGISGQEGLQAVNSSDYAIARFSYLERLLLVHGRWNYRRMSRLVVYMFYKNIFLSTAQYWYLFYTGYSGEKFFLEAGVQLYNILFTSLPIIALAVLDRDVSDTYSIKFPKLYYPGPFNEYLNTKIFWCWVGSAIFESLGITIISIEFLRYNDKNGETIDLWMIGNVIFTLVIIMVNFKLLLEQKSWSWFNYILYLLSILFWLIIAYLASNIEIIGGIVWERLFLQGLTLAIYWLSLIFTSITLLLPSFLIKGYKIAFYPEYYHVVSENEKLKLNPILLEWNDTINLPSYRIKNNNKRLNTLEFLQLNNFKIDKNMLKNNILNKITNRIDSISDRIMSNNKIKDKSINDTNNNQENRPKRKTRLSGFAFSNDTSTSAAEAVMAKSGATLKDIRTAMSMESFNTTVHNNINE